MATRKIDLLLRAGVDVHVFAQSLADPLLVKQKADQLHWLAQEFAPEQVDKVFLVIAATDDVALNAAVSEAAQQRYRLVNVVDDQPKCSFIFPSIVDRSPLVVAISSGGQAPVLARLLREKLEALLPASLGDMARVAGEWRDRVKDRLHSMRARRQFWERLFNSPFADQIAAGQQAVAEETLRQQLDQPQRVQGDVALVGAGPGDAGLLTLRGLQLIQLADVVLYDYLVSPEVLELVRRDAEKICVGKRASAHSLPQGEINRLLFTLASSGKRVVRLKGGDPFIFVHGSAKHTDIMKTEGLKQALDKYGFDATFGGARRDEEKSRAKERIYSFRDRFHRWDPKNQRPELWHNYNGQINKGESIRVFPLSNWTELDIWQYIYLENIDIVPLYLAAPRPVLESDGMLLMVDDDRIDLQPGEVIDQRMVRFRTLGCWPLTGAVESQAQTLPEIIEEMLISTTSERQGRVIDRDQAGSMELKKRQGYF
ncbi:MAG: sulfate adenylyltransferase subunit CysD [Symbiopectobacterium sp.]|uniref:sulfate adenylyltransferase subunit CysD n=1 Tax=Symbiopectobacterium sp. TaxID=2952789 RepID=UPI0039ED4973